MQRSERALNLKFMKIQMQTSLFKDYMNKTRCIGENSMNLIIVLWKFTKSDIFIIISLSWS